MDYQISRKFITKNRSHEPLTPIGITLHDTEDPGATDEAEQKYFDGAYRGASAHYFVDWDSITQLIPTNEVAWHAGQTANHRYIGIELCKPKTHNPTEFQAIWERGVWLFAYLFVNIIKMHTVTTDNCLSHDECRQRFKDTTHTDPTAYFAEYGKTVDNFRNAVQAKINEMLQAAEYKMYFASDIHIKVNGVDFISDVIVKDGRTYAPVRQLSEACGHSVDWDEKSRTVKIKL